MEFIKKCELKFNNNLIKDLSKKFDLCEDIIKLLFEREINTEEKIENYLSSCVKQLNNPFLLKNILRIHHVLKLL